jgi:hypothetical protein
MFGCSGSTVYRGQLATDVTPGPCSPAVLGYTFQSGLSHDSGGEGALRSSETPKNTRIGEKYTPGTRYYTDFLCFVQTNQYSSLHPKEFD